MTDALRVLNHRAMTSMVSSLFLSERHKLKYDFRNGLHHKLLITKTADLNDYNLSLARL